MVVGHTLFRAMIKEKVSNAFMICMTSFEKAYSASFYDMYLILPQDSQDRSLLSY